MGRNRCGEDVSRIPRDAMQCAVLKRKTHRLALKPNINEMPRNATVTTETRRVRFAEEPVSRVWEIPRPSDLDRRNLYYERAEIERFKEEAMGFASRLISPCLFPAMWTTFASLLLLLSILPYLALKGIVATVTSLFPWRTDTALQWMCVHNDGSIIDADFVEPLRIHELGSIQEMSSLY
eukprot:CAMPEP_0197435740 /NCGR_PEP_ID=MMETSP1175-20131217/3282_1 /TAXON_ID=1003142 /ORGANISM="Triceratium dubium, Strain CCMP147" /LENGTH=179 /DNA_ID=CAMNT_0042964849 /DNA_START=52 /DNA_END=591 /DNA_ORIENTATION=-